LLGLKRLSDEDLVKIVRNVVSRRMDVAKKRGEGAYGPLMGEIMKEARGKADGARVGKMLREELQKIAQPSP
jgi:glutamyl-tRNA(Gln) amidotransferase subunit E